jgi:ribosomal protein S27AE
MPKITVLNPNEKVIRKQESIKAWNLPLTIGPGGVDGHIYLTNQRIIYESELFDGFSGLITRKKTISTCLALLLERVLNVKVDNCRLVVNGFEFSVPDTQSWKNNVISAIDARKKQIEQEKKREHVHILLDFTFLKGYIKDGGLVLQKVQCPACGAPIELPDSGQTIKCGHCGGTVYAQDIFEKVKSLIG